MDGVIDMWYGDRFVPGKYYADVSLSGWGRYMYYGSICDENGNRVGIYRSNSLKWIENNFNLLGSLVR